ncbi:hypothetical protein RPR59_10930 [Stakelama saccharophila]|uniref:Uncharacterized protein n=1 Tax=Stakelama saccharophila TaxID=3075605 RepID=A0ABZ0B6N5_9SPHN|nr:hypothetical protein [Stakelama sp. W311]WNO52969.1 hypothetical protein RPR59_10930 [Stakelama sp. W311]
MFDQIAEAAAIGQPGKAIRHHFPPQAVFGAMLSRTIDHGDKAPRFVAEIAPTTERHAEVPAIDIGAVLPFERPFPPTGLDKVTDVAAQHSDQIGPGRDRAEAGANKGPVDRFEYQLPLFQHDDRGWNREKVEEKPALLRPDGTRYGCGLGICRKGFGRHGLCTPEYHDIGTTRNRLTAP